MSPNWTTIVTIVNVLEFHLIPMNIHCQFTFLGYKSDWKIPNKLARQPLAEVKKWVRF